MARQIYYDFIYSRVQYGIEVYSSFSETHINRLQVIQNKLSKLIHNLDRLTATIILYKEINILKVTHIDESSVLGFVNKVLCGQCPAIFLSYYISKHQPRASKVKHTSNTLQMDVSPVFIHMQQYAQVQFPPSAKASHCSVDWLNWTTMTK